MESLMVTTVNNILRSIHRAQSSEIDKLNILTICRNTEKYIGLLCQTQHNFYIPAQQPWNDAIEKRPSNLYTLLQDSEPLDYIICYDRAEQYEEALQMSRKLHVPIILVDMCSQFLVRPHHLLEDMKVVDSNTLNRNVILQIYSNNHIGMSWSNSTPSITIPIGINVHKFQNQQLDQTLISMDNNTIPQVGAHVAKHIRALYPILPTDHDNIEDITFNKTRYFINTNKSITVKTLEAMAAGNVVICMKNRDTENFIKDQETGILINEVEELPTIIQFLEKENNIRTKISQQARQKIILEHSLETFLTKWVVAFNMVKSAFYNHPI